MKYCFVLLLGCLFLLSGCATTLPTFAHVHVGHTLSGWVDTPGNKGLFAVSEELAVDMVENAIAASELVADGQYYAAAAAGARVAGIAGTPDADITEPADYRFSNAFNRAIDHLRYAAEAEDATANLSAGLREITRKSDDIAVRASLIRELAMALGSMRDEQTIADAVQQLRVMTVQNLEGGDGQYSLRQMRDDLAAMLDRENPPYTPPERKFLFGVLRLPDGGWFWDFKNADDKSTYGRYNY